MQCPERWRPTVGVVDTAFHPALVGLGGDSSRLGEDRTIAEDTEGLHSRLGEDLAGSTAASSWWRLGRWVCGLVLGGAERGVIAMDVS